MKLRIAALLTVTPALLLCQACRPQADIPPSFTPIDPARLVDANAFKDVEQFVALGPRDPGTPGAARAATYLHERLEALGLETVTDTFEDPTPKGPRTFRNVIATSAGPSDRIVVLVSHYDTKALIDEAFVGANDSGSSTGLLLALAPILRDGVGDRLSVKLIFVDGEECLHRYGPHDGLHGSRRMAQTLKNGPLQSSIEAVIVVDMIGDRDLNVSLPRNGSSVLTPLAFRCAEEEGIRDAFSLFKSAIIDDHVPFLEAGFHAVDLIDFHFGSAPGKNDYWHTSEDTMDKLSAESLGKIGRIVIRMLNAIAVDPVKR